MKFSMKMPALWGIGLLMVAAAGLRLFHLGTKPFWSDEGIIWWIARGAVEHDAPASYAYTLGWSSRIFGTSEFAGRFPSAIYGILSVAVTYIIGRTFFNRRLGWIAALAAVFSAYLIPLSQELRVYCLLGLIILLTLGLFLKLLREGRLGAGYWVALFAVGLIGQYTHCFFIFVLGYFGLILILRSSSRNWRVMGIFSAVTAVVLIITLPGLRNTLALAGGRPHAWASDPHHLMMNVWRMARGYFGFFFGDYLTNLPGGLNHYLLSHPGRAIIGVAMILTILVVLYTVCKSVVRLFRGDHFPALVVRVLAGMVALFTLLFLVVDVSSAAHLIFIFIPLLFLLAISWETLQGRVRLILAAALVGLSVVSLGDFYGSRTFACERADWRAAGKFLGGELKESDAVLLTRSRDAYYTLKFYLPDLQDVVYYLPRHDPRARQDSTLNAWWMTTTPTAKVRSLLGKNARVWWLESDPRRDMREGLEGLPFQSWDFGINLRLGLIAPGRR